VGKAKNEGSDIITRVDKYSEKESGITGGEPTQLHKGNEKWEAKNKRNEK
jgi:hypothetical protein